VLELTDRGRGVVGDLVAVKAEVERELLGRLSPAEQAFLRQILLAMLHGTGPGHPPEAPG
jgi:hypothetical protein